MVGILLVTHNGLGDSLLDCVRHVTGSVPAHLMSLSVMADDDPQKIRHVIRCAKKGCFAEQMVVKPVPLTGSIKINGQPFEL